MGRVLDAKRPQESFDLRVGQLARAQHGVFARAQVARFGATKGVIERRLRAGRWEAVGRGVFRVVGSQRSWRQALMVACLAWGSVAVVSHRAAAALWRLSGFQPDSVELTVPRNRRRQRRGGHELVHQNFLPPGDVTTMDGIPVTTPARTLIDLASDASKEAVEEALDDALNRGVVSMPRLRWTLERSARQGRPGVAVMRALITARGPVASVPKSVFETRLLRVLRRGGLPEPVAQHPVRSGGRVVAVVDFAYPEARLAIEADSLRWHSGRARFERDLARRNELTLLGWRIVHVTWTELKRNPGAVVASVERALAGTPH